MMAADVASARDNLMQRLDPGGLSDGPSYMLLAMAENGYEADGVTDTLAVHTAMLQRRAGNWHVGDASRSPIQESEIARTARGMRVLQLYGPPALKPEFAKRIARARDWIAAATPKTTDDAAMQMVGLRWAGASTGDVHRAARRVVDLQRGGGGWGQNPNLASDAFATGEALWALLEAGQIRTADAVYRRGSEFLLRTQWPDGSWHVRSRAPKFQPYFQSGFPFDHDQWISSFATAWAVMALAPGLPESR
jgi:hypothetical protein